MVNMGVITTGTKRDGSPKCGYFHRSFFLEFFVGKVRQKIKVIVEVGFGEHVFLFSAQKNILLRLQQVLLALDNL